MRFLVAFIVLAVFAFAAYASPAENYAAEENAEPAALLDVDAQGHENVGEREARQFGFGGRGGYGRGGYGGGFGGGRGGYGGFGGGRGGYGGGRGGYGGYGGGGFGGGGFGRGGFGRGGYYG